MRTSDTQWGLLIKSALDLKMISLIKRGHLLSCPACLPLATCRMPCATWRAFFEHLIMEFCFDPQFALFAKRSAEGKLLHHSCTIPCNMKYE